jgi:ElaB/YqjD/DUF883 family membrane-anchored ribosome-binding protein
VENEPEVIRQQMQETRTALAEKLEALEQQVTDTVQEARSAVTETVETVRDVVHDTVDTVKDTVEETVNTVKETFDLTRQVERHPWAMVGGSVALGFVTGRLVDAAAAELSHRPAHWREPSPVATFTHRNGGPVQEPGSTNGYGASAERGVSWLGSLASRFHNEIDQLKSLAIGAAIGVARDLIKQNAPEPVRDQVTEIMDGITTKLGGQPVRGQVLSPTLGRQETR